MNKEIQRFLSPFSEEKKKACCECCCNNTPPVEDVEKGKESHTPSTSSHEPHAISPLSTTPLACHHHSHHHTPRRQRTLRPRLLAILTLTLLPIFALLTVFLLALLVMYTLIPFPEIVIVGALDGVVNASLGTLGHAVVNPDVNLRLRLIL